MEGLLCRLCQEDVSKRASGLPTPNDEEESRRKPFEDDDGSKVLIPG